MKKITHTTRQQARRARALARFNLDPKRVDDKLYQERKALELASLQSHLGA